jgi:hypothetical protein
VKIRFIQVLLSIALFAVPSRSQLVFSNYYYPHNFQIASNSGHSNLSLVSNKEYYRISSEFKFEQDWVFSTEKNDRTFRLNQNNGDTTVVPKTTNYTRLALVGGALVGTMAAVHIYQQNGWWKDNRAPFHFKEDLVYGLNVDKIGHFYGADVIAYLVRKSLLWASLSDNQALWIGAGGGLLMQTYTEVEDGFSAWGFDRVDWLSDIGGALWAPAQHYLPALRTINLKMSYHPSDLLGNPGGIGFKGQKHIIIDDYEGQTFWFSLKVEDILPRSLRSAWPDFLCIAFGYAARGVATPNPHRIYFLAPDIDLTRLIPQTTTFLKTLGEALNFIHLPLPAVRIYPTTTWFGFYF